MSSSLSSSAADSSQNILLFSTQRLGSTAAGATGAKRPLPKFPAPGPGFGTQTLQSSLTADCQTLHGTSMLACGV